MRLFKMFEKNDKTKIKMKNLPLTEAALSHVGAVWRHLTWQMILRHFLQILVSFPMRRTFCALQLGGFLVIEYVS